MRTIPRISDLLMPLDEVINTPFIPALTGRRSVSDLERQLLALPTRLGGLGTAIPSKIAPFEHSSSIKVTAPLVALIVQQNPTYTTDQNWRTAAGKVRNQDAATSAADLCC